MNGIERITQRITSDAQAEADRILGDARAEAARITAEFQAQADGENKELSERNRRAAQEREERLVSMAQMEARKVLLAAKQEVVEKAFALALDRLCAMPEDRYVAVLADLMAQASSTGTEEVVFSPKDKKKVGKLAVDKANAASGKHLTLSKETAEIRGGFLLKDRNVEVNCTFETLVRLQKGPASGAVAKLLFPDGPADR